MGGCTDGRWVGAWRGWSVTCIGHTRPRQRRHDTFLRWRGNISIDDDGGRGGGQTNAPERKGAGRSRMNRAE